MHTQSATPADIPAWMTLAAEVEAMFGPMVDSAGFHNALEKNIDRGTAFCIREQDGPPGTPLMGGILISPSPTKWEISWLAVAERWRRHHAGETLLRHALDQIAPPAEVVLITFGDGVPAGEAARSLYEKTGFSPAETGPVNEAGLPTQVFRLHLGRCPTVRAIIQRGDRFLLVQHHYHDPANLGKWSIPGGRMDPQDLNHEATLRREFREELGLPLEPNPCFLGTYIHQERPHHLYYVPLPSADWTVKHDEIAALGWFTLDEVRAIEASGNLFAPFMREAAEMVANGTCLG